MCLRAELALPAQGQATRAGRSRGSRSRLGSSPREPRGSFSPEPPRTSLGTRSEALLKMTASYSGVCLCVRLVRPPDHIQAAWGGGRVSSHHLPHLSFEQPRGCCLLSLTT